MSAMKDIKSIKVGSTVTGLEDGLFEGMTTLETADFTSCPGVIIPQKCFKDCTSLSSFTFPGASQS